MTNPDFPAKLSTPSVDNAAQGNLIGLLTAVFYGLFTLLPNSNSLMVAWPWVFVWQIGLFCPVLWLLGLLWQRRLLWLGRRLDWLVGLLIVGLVLSAGLAPAPMQAHWYSWATFCFLAALYALSSWLNVPGRRSTLLVSQGYLSLAFIVISLALWSYTTWVPELARLQVWQQDGVTLPFDFSIVELRNWAPIGHQNYVAGYLVLALPLLLGLGILQTGWRRVLWLLGLGLGLLDLYTTSSRGGLAGLLTIAIVAFGVLLWRRRLPRGWLSAIGVAGLTLLGGLALTNSRLRLLLAGGFNGQIGGEVAYRLITGTTGWLMGWSHLPTGAGPGGVPLLFQRYRPGWAGQQAEWAYQLHSTPAQLWAELGLWAIVVSVGAIGLLGFLAITWLQDAEAPAQTPPVLIGCLLSSLLGYSVVSLTDYQLDNVCISGTLVVFLAVLIAKFRDRRSLSNPTRDELLPVELSAPSHPPFVSLRLLPLPFLPLMGGGILLAAVIWLIPVHRAWFLSSQGFSALSRGDVSTFVQRLSRSHQLANWEPYYAYELGWNLGNLGLQTRDPKQQQQWLGEGISWLRQGIQSAPNQEFGYTSLAWLLLNREPKAASHAFAQSAQLVPAKRGVFYGLGLSLLAQKESELAIAAITLEAIRNPILLTSPIWQLPELKPLYEPVTRRVETDLTALLASTQETQLLAAWLHQIRGGLRWWRGDIAGARLDLTTFGTELSHLVLDLAEGKPVSSPLTTSWGSTGNSADRSGALAIAAWLDPTNRQNLLQQAWIMANRTDPPPQLVSTLTATMSRSATFDQWLKQNAPSQQYRRERAGFGVLSRHIDGPIPIDFMTVVDNVPIAQFCKNLILSLDYAPDLDVALQAKRDALVQRVLKL
ncbi:O-antigen ligase family protein [Stenomitos frigidus]|uniref:Polymerase n=1 Tax=Stenomitos frigidus ULC18 TaxID=2107698 RepID=A0A2T1DX46_9CYAN|nr:O-antigen ligase family protein [Stenomitos frigidus]PSB25042.1 polymerase [Stenomitos frigidus ULC18]